MLGTNLLEAWWTRRLPWKRGEQEWRTMGRNSDPERDRMNLAGRWFDDLGVKIQEVASALLQIWGQEQLLILP